MYIKINGTKDYVKGNKQSCSDLVKYLEKENEERDIIEKENFFNQNGNDIDSLTVIQSIDNNKKGLKTDDVKFYMLSVNPSDKELKHMAKIATNGKEINHISEMNQQETDKYNNMLKDYVREVVMSEYANGFNKGLSANDLVYYGKLEQERHYKGTDEEVKKGIVKSGDIKPGLQTHVHVVVSRKDKTQKISISPLANSKGSSNHKLNGKNVTVGIDRENFVKACEQGFDKTLNYKRDFNNSMEYYQYRKNPLKTINQTASISINAVRNPENAAKNVAIMAMDKLTSGTVGKINSAAQIIQNPESIKDALISKLDNLSKNLLPPQVRAAKEIAEKVIKPVIELGSGGLGI